MNLTVFVSMFAVGLATSVHCISMCGPMVVTYAVKSDEGDGWTKRVLANLAYQGAKLLSYLLVGLALGAIGSAFNLDGIRPWIMLAAGVFMIVIGLGMTGKVPWAARLTPRPPRVLINTIGKLRRKATSDAAAGESTFATPVAFGLLTGLMPCAPLAAAEIAAASSGNVLTGGMIMVAFGLGTLPLLFAFGTASSLIPFRWKQRLTFVLAFVVIGLGLVFVNRTAMLIGFPVNSHTIQAAITGTPATAATQPLRPSTQPGPTALSRFRSRSSTVVTNPRRLNIPANKPVRLIVNRPESDPCSKQLVFPNLGIKKDLADNGVTTIDLPATATGTFTMTCGMGMISGSLVVGGGAPGGGGLPPWSWLALTLAAIAAAFWLALGLGPRRTPASQPGGSRARRGTGKTGGFGPHAQAAEPAVADTTKERGDDDHHHQDHGHVLPVLPDAHRTEPARPAGRRQRQGIDRRLRDRGELRRVADHPRHHPERDPKRGLRRRVRRIDRKTRRQPMTDRKTTLSDNRLRIVAIVATAGSWRCSASTGTRPPPTRAPSRRQPPIARPAIARPARRVRRAAPGARAAAARLPRRPPSRESRLPRTAHRRSR